MNLLIDIDSFSLDETIHSMETMYKFNKAEKTGIEIVCPVCEKSFVKRTYHQKFCCTSCKDQYWNTVNETRRNRAQHYN